MPKKKNKLYAIVDIETTGGMAKRDKITEIGIVLHDGEKVVDTYHSLINPERSIPPEITRITGITTSMVQHAPKFYEIAKEVVLKTEGAVFVAHNVNFDYSFIREEFDRLGYTYSRKILCTVKLSRKTFPGLKSYALGNLIRHFEIPVSARHRALDDALATAEIFDKIIKSGLFENAESLINRGIKETKLPTEISLERIHNLPEKAGVYYFLNEYGKVIYVGKSINIRSRVAQHFSQITAKSEKMVRLVKDIDFTETGSELIALLLESEKIKTLKPEINKSQRVADFPYQVYMQQGLDGYDHLYIDKVSTKQPNGKVISYFSSIGAAKSRLSNLRSEYVLCEEKIHAKGDMHKRCIYFPMGECLGACQSLEESDVYNIRVHGAVEAMNKVFENDFILITEGKSREEKGLILVQHGKYQGFGYIDALDAKYGIEELLESIELRYSTIESNMIIMTYMSTHQDFTKIQL